MELDFSLSKDQETYILKGLLAMFAMLCLGVGLWVIYRAIDSSTLNLLLGILSFSIGILILVSIFYFEMDPNIIILLFIPIVAVLVGSILQIATACGATGILIGFAFFFMMIKQLNRTDTDDLPKWTWVLIFGLVILGIIVYIMSSSEEIPFVGVLIMPSMMYGFLGIIGIKNMIERDNG